MYQLYIYICIYIHHLLLSPNALSVSVQVLTLCRDTSYNILEDEMQGKVCGKVTYNSSQSYMRQEMPLAISTTMITLDRAATWPINYNMTILYGLLIHGTVRFPKQFFREPTYLVGSRSCVRFSNSIYAHSPLVYCIAT